MIWCLDSWGKECKMTNKNQALNTIGRRRWDYNRPKQGVSIHSSGNSVPSLFLLFQQQCSVGHLCKSVALFFVFEWIVCGLCACKWDWSSTVGGMELDSDWEAVFLNLSTSSQYFSTSSQYLNIYPPPLNIYSSPLIIYPPLLNIYSPPRTGFERVLTNGLHLFQPRGIIKGATNQNIDWGHFCSQRKYNYVISSCEVDVDFILLCCPKQLHHGVILTHCALKSIVGGQSKPQIGEAWGQPVDIVFHSLPMADCPGIFQKECK